ncbi:acrylate utilization transcriptional regulator AcuR [Alteromonas sp. a30]|uniref:acrylate utilization transcriptional regulator AcuR n=1 Tax=Alteromonas sp. a30 TaxID=2730917 RepID=UPI0022831B61|nr:TetR family transcriptional regulator C-terminal domain-containing protein [Alteromonas sp. a30]MCY7295515.1 TetR family transcriptional regulator [Alteromonas sp. a30]
MSENNKHNAPRGRGRPSKSGRSLSETKQALIQSGLAYFTEFGFSSSGIEQVLKQAGVPKGSFYYYFESKEAFGLAVIDSYNRFFANKLDTHLLNDKVLPLQRLNNFVQDAKEGMSRYNFQRGCLIGNLEREITLLSESYHQALNKVYAQWQKKVEQCLALALEQNLIRATVNCESVAIFFWIGWEGAVSRSKLVKNTSPMDNFIENFFSLIS